MSERTKRVDRNLPSPYRSVNFTNADAVEGDILLIKESLGRPALNCTIECGGFDMEVRFNVKRTIYPPVPIREGRVFGDHLPYLVSGEDYLDTTVASISIEAGTVYEWETGPAIQDIELVTVSGNFDIFLS